MKKGVDQMKSTKTLEKRMNKLVAQPWNYTDLKRQMDEEAELIWQKAQAEAAAKALFGKDSDSNRMTNKVKKKTGSALTGMITKLKEE